MTKASHSLARRSPPVSFIAGMIAYIQWDLRWTRNPARADATVTALERWTGLEVQPESGFLNPMCRGWEMAENLMLPKWRMRRIEARWWADQAAR